MFRISMFRGTYCISVTFLISIFYDKTKSWDKDFEKTKTKQNTATVQSYKKV